MASRLSIRVDGSADGADQIMQELARQLEALDIGEVESRREPGSAGQLPDLVMTLLVVKIVAYTAITARAVVQIIKEVRERTAVAAGVSVEELPEVHLTVENENGSTADLDVPSSTRSESAFIEESVGEGDS